MSDHSAPEPHAGFPGWGVALMVVGVIAILLLVRSALSTGS